MSKNFWGGVWGHIAMVLSIHTSSCLSINSVTLFRNFETQQLLMNLKYYIWNVMNEKYAETLLGL